MTIDLLVGVGRHVIACSRRSVAPDGADAARLEVWTVRDGKADHYRGYPLEDGLAVLRETTGEHKLDLACRALLAFNRGDRDGLLAEQLGGARLDDARVLAETFEALVISALHHAEEAAEPRPLHLVIAFADDRVRRVTSYPTPAAAVAAASGPVVPNNE